VMVLPLATGSGEALTVRRELRLTWTVSPLASTSLPPPLKYTSAPTFQAPASLLYMSQTLGSKYIVSSMSQTPELTWMQSLVSMECHSRSPFWALPRYRNTADHFPFCVVVIRKEAGTATSFDTPITIGLPPFTWTRVNEAPPSAAPAGTAATTVPAAAAPPATTTLQTCFPTCSPLSARRRKAGGSSLQRLTDTRHPHGVVRPLITMGYRTDTASREAGRTAGVAHAEPAPRGSVCVTTLAPTSWISHLGRATGMLNGCFTLAASGATAQRSRASATGLGWCLRPRGRRPALRRPAAEPAPLPSPPRGVPGRGERAAAACKLRRLSGVSRQGRSVPRGAERGSTTVCERGGPLPTVSVFSPRPEAGCAGCRPDVHVPTVGRPDV